MADARRRGMARAAGVLGARGAHRGGGDAAGRVRLRRGRLHLPATSHPAAGRGALRGRGPAVHGHRAQGARGVLDPARRAARGGLGDRVAAGGEPDGRTRPPVPPAAGVSRAGLRAALPGLRAPPRGRHAVHDAPESRADARHLRGQGPRALHAHAHGRARAAASVRRHDDARSRGELGLRAHAPGGLPARAGRARVRARAQPGRPARGGGQDLPRPLRAQLHRRCAAAALALVADAGHGRRRRRFPVWPQARADLRAHLERSRGREPVRPRSAAADLHLRLERRRAPLQRGRRPQPRRAGARHHRPIRARASRDQRHAPDVGPAHGARRDRAAAARRRLQRELGPVRRRRQPALLPGSRAGDARGLARPAREPRGAVHARHALLGPPRPRAGGRGARPGRAAAGRRGGSKTCSWTVRRSCTPTARPGTRARRTRTSRPRGSGSTRPRAGWR